MYVCMDGWMDGWMDEWMDVCKYTVSITEPKTPLLCNLLNPRKPLGPKVGSDYFSTKYGVVSAPFSTTRLVLISMGI